MERDPWEDARKGGTDDLKALPDEVAKGIAAHLEQYHRDPEAAHYWDPIVIGVPGGPVATLLIEFRGRKSGKHLSTILQYYKMGDQTAIVASKGGTQEHPVWYLNLLADPKVTVQMGRKRYTAVARTTTGEERRRWWDSITKEQPVQIEYQARTSREIPVIVLEPVK